VNGVGVNAGRWSQEVMGVSDMRNDADEDARSLRACPTSVFHCGVNNVDCDV
jgi:hypothetical protein